MADTVVVVLQRRQMNVTEKGYGKKEGRVYEGSKGRKGMRDRNTKEIIPTEFQPAFSTVIKKIAGFHTHKPIQTDSV
jgi:hypothetical protein